tara:strand:- start:1508 stop:1705 length:198 start_codon:yes stop_codon:yes gene_type:complete
MKNKSSNHLKHIKTIEKIRSKNNTNWMNLLRLAFKYDPKNSKKIVKKIFQSDKKINSVIKKLLKD